MSNNKLRKRNHKEANEFMPLTKGKLFESDDENDNCQYDWGFKKSNKTPQQNSTTNINIKRDKETDEIPIVNKKLIYHKSIKPYEIKKDEERQMYMENLAKVYERAYVYIPSFYNVDPTLLSNIDRMIEKSTADFLKSEIKSISQFIDNLWLPLNDSYIVTNRLSINSGAHKMITRSLTKYTRMKNFYENALNNGDVNYKSQLKAWVDQDTDTNTNIFQDAVGNVLLKYKDLPEVTFEEMSKIDQDKDANTKNFQLLFLDMVKDRLEVVEKQVRKTVKAKMTEDKSDESEEENEPAEPDQNRPASKALLDNKGLVPKRKKADANPRVKHRMKFKKALVRYHSQVPRTRDDMGNYQGEQSGIRVAVIKAKKFK